MEGGREKEREGVRERRSEGGRVLGSEGGSEEGRERRGSVSANDGAPVITPVGGILASAGGDGVVRLLDTSGTEVR